MKHNIALSESFSFSSPETVIGFLKIGGICPETASIDDIHHALQDLENNGWIDWREAEFTKVFLARDRRLSA